MARAWAQQAACAQQAAPDLLWEGLPRSVRRRLCGKACWPKAGESARLQVPLLDKSLRRAQNHVPGNA